MSQAREQTTKTVKDLLIPDPILDVQQTTCCIVGGGPTGIVLALLLARQGIPVILLEAHKTFDRDFRGDLIQAGAMEIMDELGLTERLLAQVPHSKTGQMEFSIAIATDNPVEKFLVLFTSGTTGNPKAISLQEKLIALRVLKVSAPLKA